MSSPNDLSGGLAASEDLFLPEPYPFAWVREGTSFWLYEEGGDFGWSRIGIDAEPFTWENRRFQANLAFAEGRVLSITSTGQMVSPLNAAGVPTVLGAGPLAFECLEPFRRWRITFSGDVIDTTAADQMAGTVDSSRTVPLRYEMELSCVTPPFIQDNNPADFATWGKGVRRDALSVGLGMRFEQGMRGEGELVIDGQTIPFRNVGMRVKRQSVRTDGLFLRGHCWVYTVFPDGRACGFMTFPVHSDGFEAWNRAFVLVDGKIHPGKVVSVPWLTRPQPDGEDVSFELETDLGVTRIAGRSAFSTYHMNDPRVCGFSLHQAGIHCTWDGQQAFGMLERSMMV